MVVYEMAHQPFSRDKLFVSIYESCKHRIDAQTSATLLTDTIIRSLYPLFTNATIDKQTIIKIAAKTLNRFDTAAGVHYAAYHPLPK
jgi:transcriptional regulator NrdR family protein